MAQYTVYILSCTSGGGIYKFTVTQDGEPKLCDKYSINNPMYSIISKRNIYTLLQDPFKDGISYAVSQKVQFDGNLSQINTMYPVDGILACHMAISPNGKYLYSANYGSGSLSEISLKNHGEITALIKVIQHKGHSVHPERQNHPHAHCAVFTPDGKYLCVVDLGLDKIIIYNITEKGISEKPYSVCEMTPGSGPRHLVFSADGITAYCSNELIKAVTVLKYRDGQLTPLKEYTCVPEEFKEESNSSAIRVSTCGKYVYVVNRGHDSISCFLIEKDKLRLFDIVSCKGKWPRDFNFTPDGKFLICANQESDNISMFRVDKKTGGLIGKEVEWNVPVPFCVTIS